MEDLLKPVDREPVKYGIMADGKCLLTLAHGRLIIVGSDGSGGKFGQDPRLRRVEWSWVALTLDGNQLGGASGGLIGDRTQTVPRSEMFAAVNSLASVVLDPDVQVELYIDNAFVVGKLQAVAAGWHPGVHTMHGDIMADLIDSERAMEYLRSGRIKVLKIKSHLSAEEAAKRGFSETAWKANQVADRLAEDAARRAEFSPGDLNLIEELDKVTEAVGRRLPGQRAAS